MSSKTRLLVPFGDEVISRSSGGGVEDPADGLGSSRDTIDVLTGPGVYDLGSGQTISQVISQDAYIRYGQTAACLHIGLSRA